VTWCRACGASGDDPCRHSDGRPRKQWHAVRQRQSKAVTSRRKFSQQVKEEALGWCAAAGLGICRDVRHHGQHAHHVVPRGRGGSNDPSNGRWLCFEAHDWVHAHSTQAEALGLLARSGSHDFS